MVANRVALLAEGVDRNTTALKWIRNRKTSPSSRRAWIEIHRKTSSGKKILVALLAEGVDRNPFRVFVGSVTLTVALLAEGVDRNLNDQAL